MGSRAHIEPFGRVPSLIKVPCMLMRVPAAAIHTQSEWQQREAKELADLGIPVYAFHTNKRADVMATFRHIANKTGGKVCL